MTWAFESLWNVACLFGLYVCAGIILMPLDRGGET